ncbi:hypothetical protein ABMX64_20305 [Vibrio vulnificus]|uniref:hypothetical protein n=1 Tax=Vibrio vulnificus TaxID=672 RepID=UPI00030DA8C0|nr:hypothetical protein [Vibrio vulnificus]MCU8465420.1 hypothetical protein [Vibrio vulnificus]OQK44874.1 hypothetical protein XM75_c20857 [Vibrio vulnificus]RZP71405.1 hypothetical protein D8T53_02000 [Vibrio vulnificus]HAS6934888.1 hypothetical protein [Vibrio vulnificus]
MIDKNLLLDHVARLLELAKARDTNQGVKVYEGALKKIREASSQNEVENFAEKLKLALTGIEAHGYFTNEEFEVVKAIRAMY